MASDHSYLNKLAFTWKPAHNPELDGVWWIDPTEHPHDQWKAVMIQSNPMWFSSWGVLKLCNEWRVKTVESYTDVTTKFVPVDPEMNLRSFMNAQQTETKSNLMEYRDWLDEMIHLALIDCATHVERCEIVRHGDEVKAEEVSLHFYDAMISAFA